MSERIISLETNVKSVATTSGELLPATARRDHIHFQNSSADTIFIRFGSLAAAITGDESIKIVSGAELTIQTPGIEAIQAITSGVAARNLTVTTNACNF